MLSPQSSATTLLAWSYITVGQTLPDVPGGIDGLRASANLGQAVWGGANSRADASQRPHRLSRVCRKSGDRPAAMGRYCGPAAGEERSTNKCIVRAGIT